MGCRLIATQKHLPGNSTRADHTGASSLSSASGSQVAVSRRSDHRHDGGFSGEGARSALASPLKPGTQRRGQAVRSVRTCCAGRRFAARSCGRAQVQPCVHSVARLHLTRLKCRCSQVPCGRHDPAIWLRHANSVGAARPFKHGKRSCNWEQRLTHFAKFKVRWVLVAALSHPWISCVCPFLRNGDQCETRVRVWRAERTLLRRSPGGVNGVSLAGHCRPRASESSDGGLQVSFPSAARHSLPLSFAARKATPRGWAGRDTWESGE